PLSIIIIIDAFTNANLWTGIAGFLLFLLGWAGLLFFCLSSHPELGPRFLYLFGSDLKIKSFLEQIWQILDIDPPSLGYNSSYFLSFPLQAYYHLVLFHPSRFCLAFQKEKLEALLKKQKKSQEEPDHDCALIFADQDADNESWEEIPKAQNLTIKKVDPQEISIDSFLISLCQQSSPTFHRLLGSRWIQPLKEKWHPLWRGLIFFSLLLLLAFVFLSFWKTLK
ncbi:MAG: hypothetical protein D6785_12515, partial [Planctomycetota bacterium]